MKRFITNVPKGFRPLINEFVDQERRAKQSDDARSAVEQIKQSEEYKKAVRESLGDGNRRTPSERGQIKNKILQDFLTKKKPNQG